MKNQHEFVEVPSRYIDRVIGNYNPVVIITTKSPYGQTNAAPYAMCMEVCHNPPLLALGVGKSKDTYRNIKAHGEFVANVPGKEILENLMITAKRYPADINELKEAGLNEIPGINVDVSRIAECKLHFECRVEWIKEAGDHFIVLGRVVTATGDRKLFADNFRLRTEELKPVHYLGKGTNTFLELGNMIKMKKAR